MPTPIDGVIAATIAVRRVAILVIPATLGLAHLVGTTALAVTIDPVQDPHPLVRFLSRYPFYTSKSGWPRRSARCITRAALIH
jgi:hypothetical protein